MMVMTMGLWTGIMMIMMMMGLSAGIMMTIGLMCYFARLWIYKFSNVVVFWTKMSFFISDEWFLPPLCHLDVLMSWCPPFQRVIALNEFGKLQMAGNSPQKTSFAFSLILMAFLLETLIPSFFVQEWDWKTANCCRFAAKVFGRAEDAICEPARENKQTPGNLCHTNTNTN